MTLPDCMMPDGADPCAGYQALAARVRELEAERASTRDILAGGDYGSLPNDWNLPRIAEARMDDIYKLTWQVRDTCARAERAESRVRELEARVESMRHDDWGSLTRERDALRAENERLRGLLREALQTIHELVQQQAMDDPWWTECANRIDAALGERHE